MSLREFIVARYDRRTREIIGAELGSYAWHHEVRHAEQFRNWLVSAMYSISRLLRDAGVASLPVFCLAYVYGGWFASWWLSWVFVSVVLLLPWLVITCVLEMDAHLYAWSVAAKLKKFS